MRSNSSSDSILIERIPSFIACSISSADLATPEKTIFLGSAPALMQRFNSLPETTSNPEPNFTSSLSI